MRSSTSSLRTAPSRSTIGPPPRSSGRRSTTVDAEARASSGTAELGRDTLGRSNQCDRAVSQDVQGPPRETDGGSSPPVRLALVAARGTFSRSRNARSCGTVGHPYAQRVGVADQRGALHRRRDDERVRSGQQALPVPGRSRDSRSGRASHDGTHRSEEHGHRLLVASSLGDEADSELPPSSPSRPPAHTPCRWGSRRSPRMPARPRELRSAPGSPRQARW